MIRKRAIGLLVLFSICHFSIADEQEPAATESNNQTKTVNWYLEHPDDLAKKILDCSAPDQLDSNCEVALEAMLASMK